MSEIFGDSGSIPTISISIAPRKAVFNRFAQLFGDALERIGAVAYQYEYGLRELAKANVIIFHWPARLLIKPGLFQRSMTLARLFIARKRHGLKLVWVAHNVMEHEGVDHPSVFERLLVQNLDGIIYLSQVSRPLVHAAYAVPEGVIEQVTVHGAYEISPPCPFAPPEPDGTAQLLSFGLVRPYKNLDELVAAAATLNPTGLEIVIRGRRHDRDYARALERIAAGSKAVRMDLRDDILSDEELDVAIDNAHGVVLPYRQILNSGSAIHALSRGRPVLVPAKGSMPELQKLMGERWVQLYEGELTAQVLEAFAGHVRAIPAGAVPDLDRLSWDKVERDLAGFLDRLLDA